MVKQWKKSLEQSEILSDGQPFDGANIDAPISDAGGINWGDKNIKFKSDDSFSGYNSVLEVTGSGYLLDVQMFDKTNGVPMAKYEIRQNNNTVKSMNKSPGISTIMPFDSELDVTVDENSNDIAYTITWVED